MSLSAPPPASVPAASLKIGIAAARYNQALVDALLERAVAVLLRAGVKERNLAVVRVPGSYELPSALQLLAARRRPDALLALGVLIRGDTLHYELVASSVGHALQQVALEARRPVINGVVVAENRVQAAARCRGRIGRGEEFARAALEMAALKKSLSAAGPR